VGTENLKVKRGPMEKQYMLDNMSIRDSWRLFHIMAEFAEGFENLADVQPAITFFGSARCHKGEELYENTYNLAKLLAKHSFNIITGGGPGVMEAANKGAKEAGVKSIGINIELPFEQKLNTYTTTRLSVKYFFVRKVLFLKYAMAYVVMPGGFGTLDEFTEALTLIQTKKMRPFPIVLVGSSYWTGLIEWMKTSQLETGKISKEDMEIFKVMDDPQEIVDYVKKFVIL
jgi:uncharacterized protein (TIGR00730 family)